MNALSGFKPKENEWYICFLSDAANNYFSKHNPTLKYKSLISLSALKLFYLIDECNINKDYKMWTLQQFPKWTYIFMLLLREHVCNCYQQ